jgi:predicted SPOUT superfamily RNA methylase MTH1
MTNSGIPSEPYSRKLQNDHIQHRNKMCGNSIERVKIVINGNLIEQVTDFKYLGYRISECKSDLEDKLQTNSKINGTIGGTFWKGNEQRNKIKNSQHYS